MKKNLYIIAAAGLLTFGISGMAQAFHGGGVAHCDGCHSMHNSENVREGIAGAADLMKGSDPSSTCLNCHDGNNGYHINSTDGRNVSQGGDFFWVSADWNYGNGRGGLIAAVPDNKGHNIVAFDYGLTADATNLVAPGGTVSSVTLGCTDCHDPHGQVDGGTGTLDTPAISVSGSYGAADPTDGSIHGNFRLLGDNGYKDIVADAPVATSRNGNRTTGSYGAWTNYGNGMSAWCLSCHTSFASSNMHPIDAPVQLAAYNAYEASGSFNGVVATAFDALVPFERGITDGNLLDAQSTVGVEDVSDIVMCLSCHRAHASAHDNALRWDGATSEYLAESAATQAIYGATNGSGAPIAVQIPNGAEYYKNDARIDVAAEYGHYQRSLCNKCHVKD